MKRMWTIRKDGHGVSPVIATILMVAITVVLAAVLYVMVTGLIGGGTTAPPNVTTGDLTSVSAGTWTFQIAAASRSEGLGQYQLTVLNGTSIAITAQDIENYEGSGVTENTITLVFTDLTADDKLNSGDFFRLSGGDNTSDYTVILTWLPTGNEVGRMEIIQ